jgi:hypothetical protein
LPYIEWECVNLRVDGEGRAVDRTAAFHHLPGVADEDEVSHAHVSERLSERVDPEVVGQFGVPGGDVPRDAFLVAEMGEQAERRRQALFAVEALLLDGGERRRRRDAQICHELDSNPLWPR